MVIQDIADTARYRHLTLRSPGRPLRVTYRRRRTNDGKHAPRVTPDRSPPQHRSSGWGESPVSRGSAWTSDPPRPAYVLERVHR
jgi:hypothetical protein